MLTSEGAVWHRQRRFLAPIFTPKRISTNYAAIMVHEAQRVVDEGIATRAEVDQLMMDCFRWPSGPFGMVAGAGSGWS